MDEEIRKLRQILVDATDQPENVTGWVDRLGAVAFRLGLNRAKIHWGQAPVNVAHDIVRECYLQGKMHALAEMLHA